jgi:hypothetical protein
VVVLDTACRVLRWAVGHEPLVSASRRKHCLRQPVTLEHEARALRGSPTIWNSLMT